MECRELERAAEAERQAEREAALLHTALDMQVCDVHVCHVQAIKPKAFRECDSTS
jgi:hypothetical protein